MKSVPIRPLLFIFLLQYCSTDLQAQLDTIHWIPPMFASIYEGNQFIDLSTPETIPFPVTIRNGAGTVLKTVMISRSKAFRYKLSDTYSPLIVPDNAVQVVLPASGVVIHGPKPFHTGFRFISNTAEDAVYLTSKGRAALGTIFRIGNMWQVTDKTGVRKNMISIMATENSTQVTLSGFDPTLVEFWNGPITVILQRGESIIYTHYIGGILDDQPRNGFMGALVTATRPVVVTSGSWMGAPVIYNQANDIGVDQLLPLEQVGKEYILCMGNGPTSLERPIVIAHSKDTRIWINDAVLPDTILQAGQYFVIPTYYYLPRGNMYVHSSEPVFMYQMIGGVQTGSSSLKTASLMVVPPIQCGLPNKLDNIYLPNTLNTTRFDGGLMVVALRNVPVKAWVEGVERSLGDPTEVPGNPEFVTYRSMSFFEHTRTDSTMRIESEGPIQVSMVLRKNNASYAALFSGPVLRKPVVHLSLNGDGICPDTLQAEGIFDGIQWIFDDSLFQDGPGSRLTILAPGKYEAIAYINGCRITAAATDSIVVSLAAPQFQYETQAPSCYNLSDGQIMIGAPDGGTPPYQYSIDFGQHFYGSSFFDGVHAGLYKLVVADVSGCFNQPVHVNLGQPDSLFVHLFFHNLPDQLHPGDEVTLEGSTGIDHISSTVWNPTDSALCSDCLVFSFHPEKTGWIRLTVFDEDGCPASDSILVQVTPAVFAPNVIQPGSSLGNELFTLYSEHPLPVKQLRIFSRWGELLFEKYDFFTNNALDGWNGTFHDKRLQPGVYVFTALVEVAPGRVVEVTGDIMVCH